MSTILARISLARELRKIRAAIVKALLLSITRDSTQIEFVLDNEFGLEN